ncbi:ATP synthase F1 subunit epsilon [Mycoplasmopsis iners]|uniref:ATP synthase F1 subunit epsilon n=1 Tax=Mycoplasmopsis iners TaxID=76630 RepID=UPI00049788F7|nr:ATP synthase F1 subunit epsilon [Mycoplasmopsis iners]
MAKKTYLKIITVNGIFYEGEVEAVNLKTKDGGAMTILADHSTFVSNIDVCKMTINYPHSEDYKICSIGSGLLYVDAKSIKIITDDIIYASDINIKRAESDKEDLLRKIQQVKNEKERAIFEYKLRKAINRIEVYNNK